MNRTFRIVPYAAALVAIVASIATHAIAEIDPDKNHYILCGKDSACPDGNGNGVAATAKAWVPTGGLSTARAGHTATLLQNGEVLVVGGSGDNTAEVFDPVTERWSNTGLLNVTRSLFTATLLRDGKVLVAGGDAYSRTGTAEIYDPNTGSWSLTGGMSGPRGLHTATLLHDGKVLVAGGYGGDPAGSTELFDPATGAWSRTGVLVTARCCHTATVLQDGGVVVVGGTNSDDLEYTLSSAELFDPVNGSWSAVANLHSGGIWQTATLMRDGTVLTAGGNGGGIGGDAVFSSSELFDLAKGYWSQTGSLAAARYGHSATLLQTGEVLVAGGQSQQYHYPNLKYNNLDSAEMYDPKTGMWSSAARLVNARSYHTATLLQDGRVLVVGGSIAGPNYNSIMLSSAELYGGAPQPGVVRTRVDAIEFYNPAQDHYFMTWIPSEVAVLDAGVQITGWQRTGYSFLTYMTAQPQTTDLCRFYIPPPADSHFYGRGSAECAATAVLHPDFVLEDPRFMAMYLPTAGSCPENTTKVYRVFNNRSDVNHRYTTDWMLRRQMVDKGWVAEGDGPDLVAMCAPR